MGEARLPPTEGASPVRVLCCIEGSHEVMCRHIGVAFLAMWTTPNLPQLGLSTYLIWYFQHRLKLGHPSLLFIFFLGHSGL